MLNPYQDLEEEKFWKTGVSALGVGDCFGNIWKPKYSISKKTKIITAGSCFAQNISRWLTANGYSWLETETAPEDNSSEVNKAEGYGVFSFRTGNIYTPALLRQWLAQSIDEIDIIDEVFYQDGKYVDPFRPQIPLGGYETIRELENDRLKTLLAIKEAVSQADVFIFTLGLTEAWVNKEGFIYPACPGTIAGQFDRNEHMFVNFDYNKIMEDMVWVIAALRVINPNINFLLTVSPVPLTATASDDHVLVATNYSKSVLRSVAGKLKEQFSFVDYFPSYELISSVATRDNFFEKNLRSVQKRGVAYVMQHFASALGVKGDDIYDETNKLSDTGDEICEEVLLETWNKNKKYEEETKLCLVGDSHMGWLSKALTEFKIAHSGGQIMNGSAWVKKLVHLDTDEILVPLEDRLSRDRWAQTLPFFQNNTSGKVIISNLGMQTHMSVHRLLSYLMAQKIEKMTDEIFINYYLVVNELNISILKKFISMGYEVLVISDPPTRQVNQSVQNMIQLWNYYDKKSLEILSGIGCKTLNATEYFGASNFKEEYYSSHVEANGDKDWFHGSYAYYRELASLLLSDVLDRDVCVNLARE